MDFYVSEGYFCERKFGLSSPISHCELQFSILSTAGYAKCNALLFDLPGIGRRETIKCPSRLLDQTTPDIILNSVLELLLAFSDTLSGINFENG